MKERDTIILPTRIKKDLLPRIEIAVAKSRKKSRNAWLIWAIEQGLRPHSRATRIDEKGL